MLLIYDEIAMTQVRLHDRVVIYGDLNPRVRIAAGSMAESDRSVAGRGVADALDRQPEGQGHEQGDPQCGDS